VTQSSESVESQAPFFSIIMPTRNRVALFCEALDSVLAQDCADKEVIVVNDGSTEEALSQYKALERKYTGVNFHYLVHRPNGHGQSYSMNYGAAHASGRYLCFLDDDDYWTDVGHLSRVRRSVEEKDFEVDLFLTNQDAYDSSGALVSPNPWILDLNGRLSSEADSEGSREVEVTFLLKSRGFAHLNCSIYRRGFYESIGGMDENIRYECDRDIYIRGIDTAEHILLNPAVISYHRVPDAKKGENMSTMVSSYQKRMYQLAVYEKGILGAKKIEISEFCTKGKGYQLKHIAQLLESQKRYTQAGRYARQGLAILPSVPWLAKSVYLSVRAIFE
jgi:glycosyltransferase involved in cell wall biosynthesis